MKKHLLLVLTGMFLCHLGLSQVTIKIPIIKTGTIEEDGTTLDVSSDDAEQENDGIDALFDDDIDAGWEGDEGDANILTAGMRFQNVLIPRGATINNAYIEITSHEAKSTDDVANLTIYAERVANPYTFVNFELITDREPTNAQVSWIVDEEWGLWTKHQTPDLSSIVQEIIDLPDWIPGNAIAFIIAGEDQGPSELENAREWEAFENIADPEDGGDGQNKPDRIPMLVIEYTPGNSGAFGTPIVKTGTITEEGTTLDISSDDAEQENDEIDALTDDDIDAGWEGDEGDANILTAGLRFQNLGIPQGVTVDSAFVLVYSHEAKSSEDVANITIYAENTDNAATFTENALITDRVSTTAQVRWVVDEEWGLWTEERTPNIKDIVQEIVNKDTWSPGNAIAFVFQGEDQGPSEVENAREWEAFENIADPEDGGDGQNHPERIARLIVYYGGYDDAAIGTPEIAMPPESPLSVARPQTSFADGLLYPNPTTDFIDIVLKSTKEAVIKVIDLNGKVLMVTDNNSQKKVRVDLSSLERGIYLISVDQSGQKFTKRVILE